MPATKLGRRVAEMKAKPGERGDRAFRAAVASGMELTGMTAERLCVLMGCSHDTMSRRLKNPAGLKLEELRILSRALEWDEETVSRICR